MTMHRPIYMLAFLVVFTFVVIESDASAEVFNFFNSELSGKITFPQKYSLDFNMFFKNQLTKLKEDAFTLSFEPGLEGNKFAFGYGIWERVASFGGKITILNTKDQPLWANSDRTYIGLEAYERFWFYSLSGGVLVSNTNENHDYLITLGFGFGLPLL